MEKRVVVVSATVLAAHCLLAAILNSMSSSKARKTELLLFRLLPVNVGFFGLQIVTLDCLIA